MSKSNMRVIASIKGGWSVRKGGAERAWKNFDTKSEAVEYGRKLARERQSELVVHRRDGLVSERSSYVGSASQARTKK